MKREVVVQKGNGQKEPQNTSTVNAKAAFKKFSLSKLATAKPTRKYIEKGEDLKTKQKSMIKSQLADLKPTGPGLTLIISDQMVLEAIDGKMDLSKLLDAMEKAKQGSQFYSSGTSVMEHVEYQNRVDDFFSQLKGKKDA